MAIDSWLPALLGYLIPVGLFLIAWGGMAPERARRAATLGMLSLGLATLGYAAVGYAFHLGGASVLAPGVAGLQGLDASWGIDADWGLVGLKGFFLGGGSDTPEALGLFVTYLPMCATAVLLLALSASERGRGWQVAVGGLVMATVLFPLAACWAWGAGWLSQLGRSMSLGHGYVDHAGAGVVYFLGGMAALGALVALGGRTPRTPPGQVEEMPPVHFPLLANLGALLFGLGAVGWSLAVPFHVAGAQLNLPRIAVNGLLAGGGAVLASQLYCWLTIGHADALMAARGMAAGFVIVAAGAPFIPAWAALIAGVVAGVVLPLGIYLVDRVARLPDQTGAVALGAIVGVLGLLLAPLAADGRWGQGWNGIGPSEYRNVLGQGVTGVFPAEPFSPDGRGQLLAQLAGIGALGGLGFLISYLVFLLLELPYRPRVVRPARSEALVPSITELLAGEAEEQEPPAAERQRERRGWLRIFDLAQPARTREAAPADHSAGKVVGEAEEPAVATGDQDANEP